MSSFRVLGAFTGPAQVWDAAFQGTLGMTFTLASAQPLLAVWFWSGTGAGALPAATAIYQVSSQTVVPGTLNTAPAWTGAAGSGWVQAPATSLVTLPAGTYKTAVFYGGTQLWFSYTADFWAPGGAGSGGLASGPLSAPDYAHSPDGQDDYNAGTAIAYPGSFNGALANYWADVQVGTERGKVTAADAAAQSCAAADSATATAAAFDYLPPSR